MLEKIKALREKLSGKKFYALMAMGILAAVVQFLFGVNLGMPDMPPADSIGTLIQQLYLFAVGAAGRAALNK